MPQILIDRYRIVPAPLTGIGWWSIKEWDNEAGAYVYRSTHRSKELAEYHLQLSHSAYGKVA